jgi:hypothetical protein
MRSEYILTAKHSCGVEFASYAEAESPSLGAQRCLEEFPPEDGYSDQMIEDFQTKTKYICKRKEPDETKTDDHG